MVSLIRGCFHNWGGGGFIMGVWDLIRGGEGLIMEEGEGERGGVGLIMGGCV